MQVEGLDSKVVDYINNLKINYESQIRKLENNVIHFENKYIEYKEKYELLIYKRFLRSAEQLPVDENQQLLFMAEAQVEIKPDDDEESTEVKSYSRKKPGRKPLDPNLRREERIIDMPESEKTCACGTKMTKIGEETSENLQIIPR